MAMLVHLAPESRVAQIRRNGIARLRPSVGESPKGVFAVPVTRNFYASHQWLRERIRIVEGVDPPWSNFPAVRRTRKDADPVGDCVVFDIKNNEARLISYISYEMGTLTVLAVLTHREYDKGGWKNACNC